MMLALTGVADAQERTIAIDLSAMTPNAPPADFLFGRTGQGAPGNGWWSMKTLPPGGSPSHK
jgi:hypothetical protein